jgi:hypothetical protein
MAKDIPDENSMKEITSFEKRVFMGVGYKKELP